MKMTKENCKKTFFLHFKDVLPVLPAIEGLPPICLQFATQSDKDCLIYVIIISLVINMPGVIKGSSAMLRYFCKRDKHI